MLLLAPRVLITAVTLTLLASLAHAAPKLKERYREIVVCDPNAPCFESYTGSFQVSHVDTVPVEGIFDQINGDTLFRFQIGDFDFELPIGADPKYKPGDTKATLVVTQSLESKKVLIIKLSWKNETVRLRLKGLLPYADSPVALGRAGQTVFPISENSQLSFRNGPTPFYSAGYGGSYYPSTSKTSTRTVDGTTYELEKISVKGPVQIHN